MEVKVAELKNRDMEFQVRLMYIRKKEIEK